MNAHPQVNDLCIMIGTHMVGLESTGVPLLIKCIAAGTQRAPSVRRTVVRSAQETPSQFWQRVVSTIRELKGGHPFDHCVTLVCDYRNPYSEADWFRFDANHNMRQILWHVAAHSKSGLRRVNALCKLYDTETGAGH
jgi:hypothetical protein